MNKELTKIFDQLEEGFLIYNDKTKKIALANKELKSILGISNHDNEEL